MELQIKPFEIIQKIEIKLEELEKTLKDRTIDIDILLFNDFKLNNDKLTIPHPFITKKEILFCYQ